MRNVFFVKPEEAEESRRLERALIGLPKEAGVLFAGVSVIEGEGRSRFKVVVGCSRAREESLVDLVVKSYLKSEIEDPSRLIIEVHRGITKDSEST